MAKSKKKNPPIAQTETGDFFVVGQQGSELFAVDYNAQTHEVTWGTDINMAFWSTKSNKVSNFITQQQIQNAESRPKNGEHPSGRPPL